MSVEFSTISKELLDYFNVKDYGATGDGVTNDTTAIQNAINDAHAVKGRVYFPPGTYMVTSLQWYPDVYLQGANIQGTTLKSMAASPLLYYYSDTSISQSSAGIADMAIRGNSIGTIGLDLKGVFHCTYNRVVFEGFTSKGVNFVSCITHHFIKCTFANSPYGIYMTSASIGAEGVVKANYCKFDFCGFFGNTTWAVYCNDGSGIYLNACDYESNGTLGNMATGVVKGSNMCSGGTDGEELGFIFQGGWMERNSGQAVLFDTTAGRARHIMRDFLIRYPNNSSQNGIRVNNGSFAQELLIDGGSVRGHATDVITDGANAKTIVRESGIGSHSELNTATYTVK